MITAAPLFSSGPPLTVAPLFGYPFSDRGYAPPAFYNVCALPSLQTLNVKSSPYNATGDGSTDDTVAIRAALTAAQNAGGGIIYLPTGTYCVCPQSADTTKTAAYSVTINTGTAVITGSGMPAGGAVNVSFQTGQNLRFTAATGNPTMVGATFAIGTTYFMRMITPTTFNLYDTQAHAIAGGSTGKITFSSAGSGLVFGGEPCGPCFNVTTDNIIFIGDGGGPLRGIGDGTGSPGATDSRGTLSTLKFFCYGLRNPATDFVTGTLNGVNVTSRGGLFQITPTAAMHTQQFRSLCLDGQIPWGNGHTFLNNQIDGTGWDTSHQTIAVVDATYEVESLVFNCLFQNWAGECWKNECTDLSGIGNRYFLQNQFRAANVDCLSGGGNLTAYYNYFGGPNAGDNVTNGVENFYYGNSGTTITENFYYNTIKQAVNGLVVLTPYFCATNFKHNSFDTCTNAGILIGQWGHNITVESNTFTANTFNIQVSYATGQTFSAAEGFSNIALLNNTFGAGGFYGIVFASTLAVPGNGVQDDVVNFTSSGDTVASGTIYMVGGFGGSALGTWTGFAVTNLTLQSGAQDIEITDGVNAGPQVALWTGTTRQGTRATSVPGPMQQSHTGSATMTGLILSDLTVMSTNDQGGSGCAFDYDSTLLPGLPDGFTTTFHSVSNTWKIKANSAWNTLGSDLAMTNGDGGEVTFKKIGGKLVKQ